MTWRLAFAALLSLLACRAEFPAVCEGGVCAQDGGLSSYKSGTGTTTEDEAEFRRHRWRSTVMRVTFPVTLGTIASVALLLVLAPFGGVYLWKWGTQEARGCRWAAAGRAAEQWGGRRGRAGRPGRGTDPARGGTSGPFSAHALGPRCPPRPWLCL